MNWILFGFLGHVLSSQQARLKAANEDWAAEYGDGAGDFADSAAAWNESAQLEDKPQQYQFSSDNPYMTSENPMEEAMKLLNEGDLTRAILAFEAAVQKDPENVEAWRLLGQCHADNENERPAIAALTRTIELDPYNLEALLALSVSYTNDMEKASSAFRFFP